MGPSGTAITPPGPSPSPAACATRRCGGHGRGLGRDQHRDARRRAARAAISPGGDAPGWRCGRGRRRRCPRAAGARRGARPGARAARARRPRRRPRARPTTTIRSAWSSSAMRRRVGRERVPVGAREPAADERAAAGGAHELGPGVRLLVALLAGGDHGDRLGAVQRGVVAQAPRDRLGELLRRSRARARAGRARGPAGSGRRRAGARARSAPCRTASPRPRSGWLRESTRRTSPSRTVAQVLQPVGQSAHTRRDVGDLPGPRLEAVLGRGQRADGAQLDHVARETTAVRLLLERRDHRASRRARARPAARPRRRPARSACSGSRGCSARDRARSAARSRAASRTCAC